MTMRCPVDVGLLLVLGLLLVPQLARPLQADVATLPAGIAATPLSRPARAGANAKRFRVHSISGFTHAINYDHPLSYLYQTGAGCGGVAIGDVDGDGIPDLYLVNGPGKNRLYRQTAPLQFTDVTSSAGLQDPHQAWGVGATMADIDNDGDLDIYVCNYDAPNLLYENDGRGRFLEVAARRGLDIVDACYMAAACDYDRDGDLDLYLLTNRYYYPGKSDDGSVWRFVQGEPALVGDAERYFAMDRTVPAKPVAIELGRRDYLFRNDGGKDRRFTNVTDQAGIRGRGDGLSVTWWDYDQDGWTDLYVGNDFSEPDRLYRNDADGTFTDVAEDSLPHCPWFSMGADVGDLNDDGRLDFLVADMSATSHYKQKVNMGDMGAGRALIDQNRPVQIMRNALYVSTGTRRLLEAAYLSGLASSDWTWTVKIVDLDNDGRNDVYFTNGMARNFTDSDIRPPPHLVGAARWSFFKDKPPRLERNLAYRGTGPLQFEDVSERWGLDHHGMSYAAAHGDLDRDGDLDLVVAHFDEGVSVYENLTSGRNSVLIQLRAASSNSAAIGATVALTTADRTQVRQLQPVSGYLASNDHRLHFGLGDHQQIDLLAIHWPSGQQQTIGNLPAGYMYTISEPSPAPTSTAALTVTTETPLLEPYGLGTRIIHREVEYDDFARQPLLPSKLSQLGPAMAWGDVDADGDNDLFLGQGSGWMSMLYRRSSDGSFSPDPQPAFAQDEACEDMGAVLFDVDGDDDLDLYVASGGNEFAVDDPRLRDRLYLNDGLGSFTAAPRESHPALGGSNGPVAAADYDGDGDVDLFVGGRMVPGAYPSGTSSFLLRNESGKLVDVTSSVSAALKESGMVTSALWTDADGDRSIDLITTHEWGPVRLWRNKGGQFTDVTDAVGFSGLTGWWNGIAGGDLDHDGDMDYVVTNWGHNTKYHASRQQPVVLYYGDFDGSGAPRLVEAEYEHGTLFPVRGRSCSSRAMPFVSEKFTSFRAFAMASLDEIYTPRNLARAQRFEANTLTSGVWLNEGSGATGQLRFRFAALPPLAQISPGFGVVVTDLNGDGHLDACIAQNFYHPQSETGRMDSGLGCVLLGKGDGTFQPREPRASGMIVPADAKSLAVTDLNLDGKPDLVVAVNDGDALALVNQSPRSARFLTVKLMGPPGNRTGIGARITATTRGGLVTTSEVAAGGGYLCQSAAEFTFGNPSHDPIEAINVIWPDGVATRVGKFADESTRALKHPRVIDTQRNETSVRVAASKGQSFAADRVKAGVQLAAKSRDRSISAFRQAFLADPTSRRALTRLGDAYGDLGQLGEATWYYQQCLAIDPEFFEAHRGLGRVQYLKGFFALAEARYRQALALAPDDTATLVNLANTFVARHRSDEAVRAFNDILKRHPSMAHAWYGLGMALHQQQKIAQASLAISRAARTDPEFVRSASVAPKCAEIICDHGRQLAERGEHQAALARFGQAARALPDFAPAYAESGHVWLAAGARDRAMKAYRKACSLRTDDWSVWNNVAWLLATQSKISDKQGSDAVAAARHAVRLAPHRPGSHDTLGVALAANGAYNEAVKAAQQAQQLAQQQSLNADIPKIRGRLELYRNNKRYVEP